jgi:hypothetical protein
MSEEFDEIIWNIWAVWECFRTLGFKAEDLYMVPKMKTSEDEYVGAGVALFSQGKKFYAFAGPSTLPSKEIVRQWQAFANKLADNGFPQEELKRRYEASTIAGDRVKFVEALVAKAGFKLPKLMN